MTTQIELKEMIFHAFHGALPQESIVGNTFVVDLLLTANLSQAIMSDCLEDTINYAEVFDVVKEEMAIPSKLLEHVAGRIISSLKDNFPQLQEVRLKLSKLNPPFSGEVHSASILLNQRFG